MRTLAKTRAATLMWRLATLQAAALPWACAGRDTPGADAGAPPEAIEVARARDVAERGEAPGGRLEVIASARSMAALADREDSGTRAMDLRTLAGRLFERAWRVAADEEDASQALAQYRAASRISDESIAGGACQAALRAARLSGDVAHDASVTYRELYRARRHFGNLRSDRDPGAGGEAGPGGELSGCLQEMVRALAILEPFRPQQAVLDEPLASTAENPAEASDSSSAPLLSPARPPRIVRIDAWPGRDSARVVATLDHAVAYRSGDEVAAGAATPRTFLELDGVDVGDAPRETVLSGIVTAVRAEATTTGSRVTLDLDGQAWRRIFYMQEPFRVVVDVARHPPTSRGAIRAVRRVVLDAGHGGKDTGAVGPAGQAEKDVTLDIVRRAGRILTDQGIEVLLTRDDDRFVSLEERTARANAFSADLFVSVHCNASDGGARRGLETYVLDTTRDEIAARIAARENDTTQASSDDIASMLSRMRLADQSERSTEFARLMERSAVTTLRMKYEDVVEGGVHTAGFYVLVGARMPSVLFESSYISNAVEEDRLASADYRQLLADAIANAVRAYREGRTIRSAR